MLAVKEDQQLQGLPIVWAEYESRPNNKEFFRDLSVVTLPTIHFYDGKAGKTVGECTATMFNDPKIALAISHVSLCPDLFFRK